MLVGFVTKGNESKFRTVDVDTDDHKVAIEVVKEEYPKEEIIRCFACIKGGKTVETPSQPWSAINV